MQQQQHHHATDYRVTNGFVACAAQNQGGRPSQQDRFAMTPHALAVFDGHGALGAEVAEMCQRTFESLVEDRAFTVEDHNIRLLCARMERAALSVRDTQFGGTTATMAFVRTDPAPAGGMRTRVMLANIGDSRTAIFRLSADTGRYIPLLETRYHDATQTDERVRMMKAGSRVEHGRFVWDEGPYRISSAMTRALGYGGVGGVSAVPDVYALNAHAATDVIVLASDGFWETMSALDVAAVLDAKLMPPVEQQASDMQQLCVALMDRLFARRTEVRPDADDDDDDNDGDNESSASTTTSRRHRHRWDNATVIVARAVSIN